MMMIVPSRYWEDKANHKSFLQYAATKLNVRTLDDWYSIHSSQVEKLGGSSLLKNYYGRSLAKAVVENFPEHNWEIWRFEKVPRGYWRDPSHVRQYIFWLGQQLGVTNLQDWNYIKIKDIPKGFVLTKTYGGLIGLLKMCYPDFKPYGESTVSKGHHFLLRCVRKLFPKEDIHINFAHPELVYKNSNRPMEFDICIPSLSLAFEFHGEQHYQWNFRRGEPTYQKQKDEEKRLACQAHNITLIEIPFWWDKTMDSLVATIRTHPLPQDFMYKTQHFSTAQPIPSSVPLKPTKG